MTVEPRPSAGTSGQCRQCLDACDHNYSPCPFDSPCDHVTAFLAAKQPDDNAHKHGTQ